MGKSEIKWITSDVIPTRTATGIFCLIERNGKLYPETCYYFKKHQQDFDPDGNEDWADFLNDEYYLPEGWYTLCDQCDKYWKVEPSFYMKGLEYPELDSHSPTEPDTEESSGTEFDTLQEGDYVENLTEQEWKNILMIEGKPDSLSYVAVHNYGLVYNDGYIVHAHSELLKTQLTASEFLRRAENTFNNQK